MNKETLREHIDEAISAVWAEYQTANGITDGDCDPLTFFSYDALVEQIADLIISNEARKV